MVGNVIYNELKTIRRNYLSLTKICPIVYLEELGKTQYRTL